MIPLKKGSIGAAVEELQKLLKIVVDGDFGPITEKAVIEFQKLCGLKVDGIVGENTLSKLTKPAVKKETASEYLWILDNGHGGIIDGVYQTSGKRSPQWEDGTQLFEGEFNRAVVKRIIKLCEGAGIECINLVDTEEDLSLRWRTDKANDIYRKRLDENGKCIYVSIHANAYGDGQTFNSARGIGVYHHVHSSKGQKLAKVLQPHLVRYTGFRDRGIKANETWANFYVLRKTHMPAILSENGFMTNLNEVEKLFDNTVRQHIAKAHAAMIREVEKNGL